MLYQRFFHSSHVQSEPRPTSTKRMQAKERQEVSTTWSIHPEAKHTGALEVYHSLLLKYCEKRNHFSKEGMFVRTALAALDNNYNVGRFQARTNSGDPRYKVVYPKGRKDWVAKPITETKSYNYLAPMVHKVIEARLSDPSAPPVVQPPQHPGNIAPIPRPPKHDIIAKHKSRFF